jgi:hypothetical protein
MMFVYRFEPPKNENSNQFSFVGFRFNDGSVLSTQKGKYRRRTPVPATKPAKGKYRKWTA